MACICNDDNDPGHRQPFATLRLVHIHGPACPQEIARRAAAAAAGGGGVVVVVVVAVVVGEAGVAGVVGVGVVVVVASGIGVVVPATHNACRQCES